MAPTLERSIEIVVETLPLADLRAQYQPLREEILTAIDGVLDSLQLFLGKNVQDFEAEFAEYCGVRHAVGVGSGTEALHLALLACGVGPGDEVITVSHTFIATVEAICLTGAAPVMVDIDPDTYTIDVSQIEGKVTSKTRAIVPVHLYGQCADMDPILDIAEKHSLAVVEDACQAHGAEYKKKRTGSLGDVGCFSFYPSKNLGAYGEAGICVTNDPQIARRLRMLRDHGSEDKYHHSVMGVNARLDEIQAAILRVKLKRLDEWNEARRKNASLYNELLADCPVITPSEAEYAKHVYHLYVIRTTHRDDLQAYLRTRGIATGVHYPVPIHLQDAWQSAGYRTEGLSVTERYAREILSLPMYAELTPASIEYVAQTVRGFVSEHEEPPVFQHIGRRS
jgi:dTDP-4-amino-4,6-dideoxygalactose transaminase